MVGDGEEFSDSLGRFGVGGGLSPGVKDQHESSAAVARDRLREMQQAQGRRAERLRRRRSEGRPARAELTPPEMRPVCAGCWP